MCIRDSEQPAAAAPAAASGGNPLGAVLRAFSKAAGVEGLVPSAEQLESELEDPAVREHVQKVVYDITGTNYSFKLVLTNKNLDSSPTTSGHLVRVARAMGAQILEEEDKTNE